MKITEQELREVYRNMSYQELLGLDRGELTDVARKMFDEELARRGVESRPAGAAASATEAPAEAWACAGVFRTADEAQVAWSVLDSAGIPARLEQGLGDLLWMGSLALPTSRVLVPEATLEDARAVIESHAAEQELAAQEHADPLPAVVLARYEDGVFKPLDPVDLDEGAEVEVHLPTTAG